MYILSRIVFFMASFSMTLGSSLAAMQGGFDIGLADLMQVPAVCWLMSFGAGCIGAIDAKIVTSATGRNQKEPPQ